MKLNKARKLLVYALLLFGVSMIVMPLYITVSTAFKTTLESMKSYLAPPSHLYLDNFKYVLSKPEFWRVFANTVFITAVVLIGNAIIMPPMAYAISRRMPESKYWRWIYAYLLLGIFIPFQVKMIPIVQMMSTLHMLNPLGLGILCISSTTCESAFLYIGYLSSIGTEMEEAAYIDGASTFQVYSRIILPLMRPILATSMIKNGLWIWNDFTLPLITLNRSPKFWTLTLYQYNFQSEAGVDYGLTFACLCVAMLPILIFYLCMQKHIISGLSSGAVKG